MSETLTNFNDIDPQNEPKKLFLTDLWYGLIKRESADLFRWTTKFQHRLRQVSIKDTNIFPGQFTSRSACIGDLVINDPWKWGPERGCYSIGRRASAMAYYYTNYPSNDPKGDRDKIGKKRNPHLDLGIINSHSIIRQPQSLQAEMKITFTFKWEFH